MYDELSSLGAGAWTYIYSAYGICFGTLLAILLGLNVSYIRLWKLKSQLGLKVK